MTPPPESEARAALRRYWGYDAFRPLQADIIASLMAGRDACVVMPTGGGKSLCYQLPAALHTGRVAIVVSPLIALMQDQVAQLDQMGIPAARLNSTLSPAEQRQVLRRAEQSELRLLYLSPERLARADTWDWLGRLPISFFAIDEAHCISEWGHEFRPEYRQLSALRQRLPGAPIAAFTASATRRVRHDILEQLQLRQPAKFIASFHRPNLRYVAQETPAPRQLELLARAARAGAAEAGNLIVYAPTIARVEQTVAQLAARGIPALAYHGKMEADDRRRNQERWMLDEVKVLVGTLAFGLGINKANVRAVIHLALPKSVEQYYQEAGRAGRDGEPADCALLWQKRDVGLLAHFIQQIEDPAESDRAWQRYREIRAFVEAAACRHRQVCEHFGERWKLERCDACDVCGYEPAWFAGLALPAPVTAPRSGPSRRARAAAGSPDLAPPDPARFERLKAWRLQTARQAGVPAYVVLHDASLQALCLALPRDLAELREVSGFGDRKVALYGEALLALLRDVS